MQGQMERWKIQKTGISFFPMFGSICGEKDNFG